MFILVCPCLSPVFAGWLRNQSLSFQEKVLKPNFNLGIKSLYAWGCESAWGCFLRFLPSAEVMEMVLQSKEAAWCSGRMCLFLARSCAQREAGVPGVPDTPRVLLGHPVCHVVFEPTELNPSRGEPSFSLA